MSYLILVILTEVGCDQTANRSRTNQSYVGHVASFRESENQYAIVRYLPVGLVSSSHF